MSERVPSGQQEDVRSEAPLRERGAVREYTPVNAQNSGYISPDNCIGQSNLYSIPHRQVSALDAQFSIYSKKTKIPPFSKECPLCQTMLHFVRSDYVVLCGGCNTNLNIKDLLTKDSRLCGITW